MEIHVGILNHPKEIVFKTDKSVAEIKDQLTAAYTSNAAYVVFADTKTREYLIPLNAIAYVEFGSAQQRKAGFIN